jgi:hypothetical protein
MPLDERPCNAWYPRYLAPIAGVQLLMPPSEMMPKSRRPGNTGALRGWLLDNIPRADAAVVAVDLLGYGGLIPGRIGHETADEALANVDALREARRLKPEIPLLAFNVIMRTANSAVNTEEPDYWTPHGPDIYRLSQLMDRLERLGLEEERAEHDALLRRLPAEHVEDYLARRTRNHEVNRAVIRLAAEGIVDFAFLSQDDASEYGLPAREQRALRADIAALNVGEKVVVYPGADEVGLVLLARATAGLAGYTPQFYPRYSSTGGENIVALFEDRPLDQTVRGEVYCVGGVVVESPRNADVMLYVNTPGAAQDYPFAADTSTTVETPARNLPDFLSSMRFYARDKQVALADVAYCNGADPRLVPLLPKFINFPQLAAFAGWNTAANTIGAVVAHATMRMLGLYRMEGGDALAREAAHQTFLFYRLLEDWGYQTVVRTELNRLLAEAGQDGNRLDPDAMESVRADVETRLEMLGSQAFGQWFADQGSSPDRTLRPEGWDLQKVTLPWGRTFEVGLELCVGVEGPRTDNQAAD